MKPRRAVGQGIRHLGEKITTALGKNGARKPISVLLETWDDRQRMWTSKNARFA